MSAQGTIAQVIGPVVDIRFPQGVALPKILDALVVERAEGNLILETQKHIGEDTVRAISMEATEGLSRGMAVQATGTGITMPTGEGIKEACSTWWVRPSMASRAVPSAKAVPSASASKFEGLEHLDRRVVHGHQGD